MRRFQVTVNGIRYEVDVEEVGAASAPAPASAAPVAPKTAEPPAAPRPVPIAAPAPRPMAVETKGTETVKAPMPGTILSVAVSSGQEVKKHQLLCVLEAMKMENEILSPRDGRIASVSVSKGSTVQAGSPLVHLE